MLGPSVSLISARAVLVALVASLAGAALSGCSGRQTPPPQAPEVSVLTVKPAPATFTEDYVAQTEAVNTVEIRPRVGGVLEKQVPTEGERVKAGELLFVIDPQPYVEALAEARASLAQSEASLEQSQRDLGRARSLSEIDAVSQQELDATVAKNKANVASVASAGAAVKTAQLNLGYTTIVSPIDGVMGRAQLRVGGLAVANSTLLTTIYETGRMYVNLSISEQRLLTLQRQLGRAPNQNSKEAPPFRLFLADGSQYPLAPKLNFIDPAVDARTGTLAIRLEVANPEGLLHAGEFARVQVATLQDPNAIVLPQRAIQDLQGKNYVWLLGADGSVQQQDVTMGPRIGENWLVQQGLKAGQRVVVDGVQRLKPGTRVKAHDYVPAPAPPAPAMAPASSGT
jgi:membrane fusion protein (multidrug efflux system)